MSLISNDSLSSFEFECSYQVLFLLSTESSHDFCPSFLTMLYTILTDFQLHAKNKSHLFMVHDPLQCIVVPSFLIYFLIFCWGFFHLCSSDMLLCICFPSGIYDYFLSQGNADIMSMEALPPPPLSFEKVWKGLVLTLLQMVGRIHQCHQIIPDFCLSEVSGWLFPWKTWLQPIMFTSIFLLRI